MSKYRGFLFYLIIFLVGLGLVNFIFGDIAQQEVKDITSTQYVKYLETDQIKEVTVISQPNQPVKKYEITLVNDSKVTLLRDASLYVQDTKLFEEKDVVYQEATMKVQEEGGTILDLLFQMLIFMGIIMFIVWIFNRGKSKSGSGGLSSMLNKKYNVLDFTNKNTNDSKAYSTTLDEVIGLPKNTRKQLDDITSTIKKIVEGKVIGDVKLTGLLLYGPPGTGKSMIAKALATSVKSYFIHVSGSDFVDKFVGQGASNVNALFDLARKTSIQNNFAPVIVFIDEIDAIGKKREGSTSGGQDEREATLNTILHHLSGVESPANVFVIGATNFKDALDSALTRSGRLSTHIEIPRPDKKSRKELFDFYLTKKLPKAITLDEDVDTEILAEYSVNMTGADISEIIENMKQIANGVEEKTHFNLDDMIELIEVKQYGTIKEELMENEKVLKDTAYHEAGHALIALKYFPHNVLKACITPRHKALGYVSHNIMDNRVSLFKEESKRYIQVTLGGYVAEMLKFKDTSSGVSNDLEQANHLARNLVQKYGAGNSLLIKPDDTFKEGLSNQTMSRQEEEMRKILEECKDEAENFLKNNSHLLESFAQLLLDKKVLNRNDIKDFYEENKEYFETN